MKTSACISITKKMSVISFAVVLVIAALTVWLLSRSEGPSPSNNLHVHSPGRTTLSQALQGARKRSPTADLAVLVHRFSLMGSRPEQMPIAFQRRVAENMGPRFQLLDLAHAQFAHTRETSIWVAYGAGGGVCIFQYPKGGLACEVIAGALKRGVFLGVGGEPSGPDHQPNHFMVMGLVPNGTNIVKLKISNGTERAVRVHNNVFSLEARGIITVAGFVRAGKSGTGS
jgi:hypothetical protein